MEIKDINLEEYDISTTDGEIIILRKKEHKYPKWLDLERLSGYYITYNSKIYEANNFQISRDNRDIFLTEKHAKSALAMAQISQLMPYYGGEITDEEWLEDETKYTIEKMERKHVVIREWVHICFLLFTPKNKEMSS